MNYIVHNMTDIQSVYITFSPNVNHIVLKTAMPPVGAINFVGTTIKAEIAKLCMMCSEYLTVHV
jgi:hypothetical protein